MARNYCKLVRDRIPEIIKASGKDCRTRRLTEEEYLQMLDQKLDEELSEFRQSGEPEELADLLEVIAALGETRGCNWERLLALREEKRRLRGGFEERILLLEVSE